MSLPDPKTLTDAELETHIRELAREIPQAQRFHARCEREKRRRQRVARHQAEHGDVAAHG